MVSRVVKGCFWRGFKFLPYQAKILSFSLTVAPKNQLDRQPQKNSLTAANPKKLPTPKNKN